jgi:hypothetical protein
MIDKNYLKAISCFDFDKYQNNPKKAIEFKANDNLDYCRVTPCQYYTLSPEIAETILNTPWGTNPFPFSMEVLKSADNASNVIQILPFGGEWRRTFFSNSLEKRLGEWVNIEEVIDYIIENKDIHKNLSENWDRYMVINEVTRHVERWEGRIVTIDEIVEQIKTGTAKTFRNKLV